MPSTLPVIERLATGQTSSAAAGSSRSAALELAVQRQAAGAFGANEVGDYERLVALGRALNQAESFPAAEDAYRAALALQERVLGAGNPDTSATLTLLALNLSNQDRRQDADALFTRAEALVGRATDPLATTRLAHYRGLHALNGGEVPKAITLLRQAETGYSALVPPSLLRSSTTDQGLGILADPVTENAVLGLAEVWRYLSSAFARSEEPDQAATFASESRSLLRRVGLEQGLIVGRALRTEAAAAQVRGAARSHPNAGPGGAPLQPGRAGRTAGSGHAVPGRPHPRGARPD